MRFYGLATIGLFAAPAIAQHAEQIHLVCLGSGSANRATSTSVFAADSWGNTASGQAIGSRSVGFGDQVDIQIESNGTGKIRMPRAMLPPFHGGKDGWFDLKNVKTTDDLITGTPQVNVINSPKLRVDRRTGKLTIHGKAGDYFGDCSKFDPASSERKF